MFPCSLSSTSSLFNCGPQLWPCEWYLARHCTSIHVSPSLSVPSLVRTHFIAHYRFPLQFHAPHHTAAATVASTMFSSLFLSRSIFSLSLITHETTFKGMLFIPLAGFHKRRCCDALFFFSFLLLRSGGALFPMGWTWDKCIRLLLLQLLICCQTNNVCTEP